MTRSTVTAAWAAVPDPTVAHAAPAAALRVALVAGSLTQGGAEKQLVYMARSLRDRGVAVQVYSLTRGEHYESVLEQLGLPPIWIGRVGNPLARVVLLARALRRLRPHVVQSGHFFTNLHVTLAARFIGAQAIGTLRNDATFEVRANGAWGRWLLHLPPVLVANSHAAVANAARLGASPARIHVVSNVLDVEDFDARAGDARRAGPGEEATAVVVCRLVRAKRVDRFVDALAGARKRGARVRGFVVGEGPERGNLERRAQELNLSSGGLQFLGRRDDVPSVLQQADMLVVSSDHEGFPNVLLEAMAARLPVVTTPAGDAGVIVRDGETGFVVPFDDIETIAARLAQLASAPNLRRTMGLAGRAAVESQYCARRLSVRLIECYRATALQCRDARLSAALAK